MVYEKMNEQKKGNQAHILLAAALILSFLTVAWTLDSGNTLAFDDVSLLSEARFNSWQTLFEILPSESYNSRPVRMLFLKALDQLFGTSYVAFHIVFVFMHLCNVALVYVIFKEVLSRFHIDSCGEMAAMTALIFGAWSPALFAVQWISSTCDFQCVNFSLLSVLCYLHCTGAKKAVTGFQFGFLSLVTYFLSLRCKEMSLPLPAVLLVFELAEMIRDKKWRRPSSPCIALLFMMLFYAWLLMKGGVKDIPPDNPYYQNFHPLILLRNLARYIGLYMDPLSPDLQYVFRPSILLGMAVFGIAVLSAILLAFKKHWYPFLALLVVCGSFICVLPMQNMQHRLYVYFPSVFIAFFFSLLIYELIKRTGKKYISTAFLTVCIIMVLSYYAPGTQTLHNWWLSVCKSDLSQLMQLERLEPPLPNTEYYIRGTNETEYTIFFYGPGNSLRYLYNEPSLHTQFVDALPDDPVTPYVFLEYDQGSIKEIDRRIFPSVIPAE